MQYWENGSEIMELHEVIFKPVITEAVYDLIETQNKIAFEVSKKANKFHIKHAVEELYNVKVKKVNTLIVVPTIALMNQWKEELSNSLEF